VLHGSRLTRKDFAELTKACGIVSKSLIRVCDVEEFRLDDLGRNARAWHEKHGIKLLVIDPVQRLVGSGKSSNAPPIPPGVLGGLKALARELHIPVLAFSDLPASLRPAIAGQPRLTDLELLGPDLDEADTVAWLMETTEADDPTDRPLELHLLRQRHGPIGMIGVDFPFHHRLREETVEEADEVDGNWFDDEEDSGPF